MVRQAGSVLAAVTVAVLTLAANGSAQIRQSRIVGNIDNSQLQRLPHSVHPLANSANDRGAAPASLSFDRMLLVLQPDSSKQSELTALLAAQTNRKSTQYHKWLTPAQFGQRFGATDSDLSKITGWLQSQGFQVKRVANGRNVIEFSGTAGQVAQAFHTEIHKYVVNGKQHWANASDPAIPAALAPVVAGVATLHNFRKASQISGIRPQAVRVQAGVRPNFTGSDGTHALAPADFQTIYNFGYVTSVADGTGTTIAIVARSNIHLSDIQSFMSAFGVPNALPQVVVNGTDPGDDGSGDEAEAVLDTSWSSALAPNATTKLVVSASTNSTDGVDLSEQYIVDNNLADVMTESYGDCEANYTPAEAQFYLSLAQQAASQGITYTVAAGDSGAEGCDDPDSETVATGPVSVNVLASTPYDVAVGGTMFNENGNSSYWSSSNDNANASATGYIPEVAWNESCTVAACGSADAGIWAGSGGASVLFSKPSWQTGLVGIPSDGARDLPDIAFSSAGHDFYLICLDNSCTVQHGQSYFSGVSGTSAATPSFAGIMALIVESQGGRQGQVTPILYAMASSQTAGQCVSGAQASSCIFNDVVLGNNAVPGQVNYGTSAALYQAGVGYDQATGLGSANVYNLFTNWNSTTAVTPTIATGIDLPGPMSSSVIGLTTFSGWALSTSGTITSISASIDSVPYGTPTYGSARTDICALYSSANCPNVGWTIPVDTTLLATGAHTFDITVTSSTGQTYTTSSTFTVANWTSTNPMKINIDTPGPSTSSTLAGTVTLSGWALSSISAISQVTIVVDGVNYGQATYGIDRPDVCNAIPGEAGCPNVGWNMPFNTAVLADGIHTLSVTAESTGGQFSTASTNFTVANTPGNTIMTSIDAPAQNGGVQSGVTNFGGWTLGTTAAISNVTATVDGMAYGTVLYGGNRADACVAQASAPSCPNVGWNLTFDTTQFVNGTHILGITSYTATGQSTTFTRLFTVSNTPYTTPIVMNVDVPSPAYAVLLGKVTFSGWATEPTGTITKVAVAIDGAAQGNATYGISRADACASVPGSSQCPNVGWTYAVDTNQLANGAHTMTITATAADGTTATLSSSFTVANWLGTNPMMLSIDNPSSTTTLSGVAGIGGWAIDQLAAISSLSISLDGVLFGNGIYGGVRTDVCSVMPNSIGCPNVGWNFLLDTTLLSDGTHTLAVTATTTAGQSSTFSQTFSVANHSSSGLQASIDTPSPNQALSSLAAVGGWAVDPSGDAIVSVTVLVDGVLNGTAVYGAPRSDVCAIITTGGGCPNVGWNYQLDTAPYANGSHMFEIRATSASGARYTVSQPFVVANQP